MQQSPSYRQNSNSHQLRHSDWGARIWQLTLCQTRLWVPPTMWRGQGVPVWGHVWYLTRWVPSPELQQGRGSLAMRRITSHCLGGSVVTMYLQNYYCFAKCMLVNRNTEAMMSNCSRVFKPSLPKFSWGASLHLKEGSCWGGQYPPAAGCPRNCATLTSPACSARVWSWTRAAQGSGKTSALSLPI